MKKLLLISALISTFTFHLSTALAQTDNDDIVIVDDEECGCELVFINGIQTTQDNGLYGFKRADGTVIAPNKYMVVDRFQGNYCKVYLDYGKCGLINSNGDEIVPCIHEDVGYPTEGLIFASKDEHYGYYDTLGNLVIPYRFLAASSFNEGLATVGIQLDSFSVSYGFIDRNGNYVIQPQYEYAFPFYNGYAVVKNYDRYGMIDRNNREVLPVKYEVVTSMFDSIFFAGDENEVALFNNHFKPITKQVYTGIWGYSDGLVLVTRDNHLGYLNGRGEEVIPCQFDQANPFFMGRAGVSKDGKWGIIDTTGRYILPLEYDNSGYRGEAYHYHDSLALIEKNERYGYVNLDGQIVVYPALEDAYQFTDGLAPVKMGQWGYIDTKGDIFIMPVFDFASPFSYGRAEVTYQGVLHKMDVRGRCVKNCSNAPKSWR